MRGPTPNRTGLGVYIFPVSRNPRTGADFDPAWSERRALASAFNPLLEANVEFIDVMLAAARQLAAHFEPQTGVDAS
jgi:hypothetical protein